MNTYKLAYVAVKKGIKTFAELSPKQQEAVVEFAKADLESGVIDQNEYDTYTK